MQTAVISPVPGFLPAATTRLSFPTTVTTKRRRRAKLKVESKAEESSSGASVAEVAAIVGGLISTPVIGWSLYTLKTTGCGLPPGPGGAIGALEGVSYLVVVGIVAWSLYTKVKTGSGLPNGP